MPSLHHWPAIFLAGAVLNVAMAVICVFSSWPLLSLWFGLNTAICVHRMRTSLRDLEGLGEL